MRYFSIILLAFVLISCEDNSTDLNFTEKWWESSDDKDYFVRFNDNGEYIKLFTLSFDVPNYYQNPLSRPVKIKGDWSLNSDQIIFETSEIEIDTNDIWMYSGPYTSGTPLGSFYGHEVTGYWTPFNPEQDTLATRFTGIYDDSTYFSNSPVIWVISEVLPDTFKLIISSKLEIFTYEKEMQ